MTRHFWTSCGCGAIGVVLASCTLGASDLPEGDNAAAVPQLLSEHLDFDGGELIEGAVPGATNPEVIIQPLDPVVIVQPGQTSIVSLSVISPIEDTDPVIATLIQYAASGRHVSVPRASSRAEVVENTYSVGRNVCETLCRRTYPVEVILAFVTQSGAVGSHGASTFTLDCTGEDVRECAGDSVGDRNTTSGAVTSGAGAGSDAEQSGVMPGPTGCAPDIATDCVCPDGSRGIQMCQGDVFGPCECEGSGFGGAPAPPEDPGTAGGPAGAGGVGGAAGGGGGGGADGVYTQCIVDADCADGELCGAIALDYGYCAAVCAADADCDARPFTGDATPICSAAQGSLCVLSCGNGETCPDEMACADLQGEAICAYP